MFKNNHIFKIMFIFLIMILLTGCFFKSNDVEENKYFNYSTYTLSNIKYKVPTFWYREEDGNYTFYRPDLDDENSFLMVGVSDFDEENISESEFEEALDVFIQRFIDDDMERPRINSKTIDKKDDFYIGKVTIKADFHGEYRELYMCLLYDNKAGDLYAFIFTSVESISDENRNTIDNIIDSVEIR